LGNVTWRLEKGHLTPEVKTANEITCDYVWNKLYTPTTISVTCCKWYIRKAPFVLSGHESTESLLACLINLLPKKVRQGNMTSPKAYNIPITRSQNTEITERPAKEFYHLL
jgi:hypothetical protein